MIIVIAPCCIPFAHNTMLHGSTANTVLPDPMLGSFGYHNQQVLLNKTIGDDLLIEHERPDQFSPKIKLFKVYDQLGPTLFEYTLYQTGIIGTNEPYYVPISVKRYDAAMPYTFFFARGVTLALDSLRGFRNYSIISATAMMKMFSGNAITFVDNMFSVQLPRTMDNILSELGSYAFHDPSCSDVTLRTMFEELSKSYDCLLAYDKPTDIISYYGCHSDNIIPQSVLNSNTNMNSNVFYSQFEYETHEKLRERAIAGMLEPLDINVVEYHMLHVEDILNEIYQALYTDISMIVEHAGPRDIHRQKLFGMKIDEQVTWSSLTVETSIATYLHDGIIYYNQHMRVPISMVVFSKNWLDDLHLDVYFEDGTIKNFYLNLALYHLYSPSIVRIYNQVN